MHPLVQQLALELLVAVPLVGAVHLLAVRLRVELRRLSETAQSMAMAVSLLWVMSGGPRIALVLWQQFSDLRALVRRAGVQAFDQAAAVSLLPGLLAALSLVVATAVLVAVVMEWHSPAPDKRTPPGRK
jgi:hypothetical protein